MCRFLATEAAGQAVLQLFWPVNCVRIGGTGCTAECYLSVRIFLGGVCVVCGVRDNRQWVAGRDACPVGFLLGRSALLAGRIIRAGVGDW